MVDEKFIAERIAHLRSGLNVSARDMSLSIGQSPNYINTIENGKSLPSMAVFLYICEFLKVSPEEFFDEGNPEPTAYKKTADSLKGLNREQLELIEGIAKQMKR